MSHFQAVEPTIPWALVGTLTGLGLSAAVFVWWIYAYIMYWMNKHRRSVRYEDDDEDDVDDEPPPPRRQPRRRARSRRRREYDDDDDDY